MRFYDQYEKICVKKGIDPCSQRAAEMFGVTRSTISIWNAKNTMPRGETVKIMADALNVSADYLLGRTSNPTDFTDPDLLAELAGPVLDEFNGDAEKALAFQDAVAQDVIREKRPHVLNLFNQLDPTDQVRAEAYIEGILTSDKYRRGKRAAR